MTFSALIGFITSGDPYVWRGYLYVAGLFGASVLSVLFMQHSFNIGYTVGMRTRTAVITTVYRKVRTTQGGIPPTDFTVYFNTTICQVANYTTLYGHIVLVN